MQREALGEQSPIEQEIAPPQDHKTPPVLATSVVLQVNSPTSFIASVQGRARECALAASCLLVPQVGDEVLLSVEETRVFVLSVLVRPVESQRQIGLGGGATLVVEDKKVSFQDVDELHLKASKIVNAQSEQVNIRADRAGVVVKTVDILGRTFASSFDRVRTLARSVDSLADTVTATMKQSLRLVSDIDQTRARTIDTRAEGTVMIHGENTAVTARTVTKIDSSQIQIG